MSTINELMQIAIRASIKAGMAILEIYDRPEHTSALKKDNSPLTEADLNSNRIIYSFLNKTIHPIISEENNTQEYHIRKKWDYCWIVDPLDGTKEFMNRNDEFTVNIALCKSGMPVIGVIYVPVSRTLYFGNVKKMNSYKIVLDKNHSLPKDLLATNHLIYPSKPRKNYLRVVGSRSHMNKDTLDFISEMEKTYENIDIVSKGSSLKFCLVAEGKADVYPRFAPTMEWDTAAGQAICMATGLAVVSKKTGLNLMYNKEKMLNPSFIVRY